MTTPITGNGPGVYVPQPQVGAQRYGLFSAANGPFPFPPHAEISGVEYEAMHCGDGYLWPPASCAPPGTAKTFDACNPFVWGSPFTMLATYEVSAIGRTEEQMRATAETRLRDNQQTLAEQMLWGGRTTAPVMADLFSVAVSSNAVSAMQDVTPTPGTAVPLTEGVGLLEEFLAQYPYRGILHARPKVSSFATERLQSVPDGKPGAAGTKYLSPMGNVWSFGRGYSGNKPDDAGTVPAAGTAYIAATGPVTFWNDPTIHTNPPYRSMDRSSNTVFVLSEQSWAGAIECVIGYVLVTLTEE